MLPGIENKEQPIKPVEYEKVTEVIRNGGGEAIAEQSYYQRPLSSHPGHDVVEVISVDAFEGMKARGEAKEA